MSFVCDLCGKVCATKHGLSRHRASDICRTAQAKNLRQAPQLPGSSAPTVVLETIETRIFAARKKHPILRHIPAGARRACAESYTAAVNDVCSKNDEESWAKLLLFPLDNLHAPPAKAGRGPSLAASVKANLRGTSADSPLPNTVRNKTSKKKTTDETLRKLVNAKLQDGDISGAVKVLTSEDTVAALTGDVIKALRDKHPDPPADLDTTVCDVQPVAHNVSPNEILVAVKSFPAGSSAGPDGLRPQHLKEMVSVPGETGGSLLSALSKLANLALSGKIPAAAKRVFFGGMLTPLLKKNGGIRPIACGCTLRRLFGKVISRRVQDEMGELFRPVQLGYGTRGGAEAAVHAARKFVRDDCSEVQVVLKLDFANAFNTVRRDVMLKKVAEVPPQYYAFISAAYSTPSSLFCGDQIIASAHGIQQGDPLGPLLFCLISANLSRELQSELNIWFLDDGTCGGDPDTVLGDFMTILGKARTLGLQLNLSKCELHVFGGTESERKEVIESFHSISPEILLVSSEQLDLLGAPLTDLAIGRVLDGKIGQIRRLTDLLGVLPAHQSLFLLKNSLSLPRLLFTLRCAPSWKCPDKLRLFDDTVRRKAEEITNVEMSDTVWRQAILPDRLGGIGLCRAEDVALPAYLSSCYATDPLVCEIVTDTGQSPRENVVKVYQEKLGEDPPPMPSRRFQPAWTGVMYDKMRRLLVDNADVIAKARLLALSTKESSAWLSALPVSSLGNLLDDVSLRVAVALRLGTVIMAFAVRKV
ncbi:uncharacterized protein LOC129599261 [Paramacrobiotus metropolitanus]|uniref:uncharacterized protein LOC129599261 n=1 Tax=Paramacrobiotus metropolitanus TaxID=2943436 RepID=UPI002445E8A9|nr:uncharacterized protein LOC129599261 [Paramacrobiotus metropolitanus]